MLVAAALGGRFVDSRETPPSFTFADIRPGCGSVGAPMPDLLLIVTI